MADAYQIKLEALRLGVALSGQGVDASYDARIQVALIAAEAFEVALQPEASFAGAFDAWTDALARADAAASDVQS